MDILNFATNGLLSSSSGSSFTGYSHVTNYASLPAASTQSGNYYIVDSTTGIFLTNQKKAGFYKSDGTNWNYIGTSVETTSISDGTNTVIGAPVILSGGNGITVSGNSGTGTVNIIQTPQTNSDWNSLSGISQILNKPTIPSISGLAIDNTVVHLAGTEVVTGQKTFNSPIGIGTSTFGTNNKLAINPYITVDNLATSIITPNAATNKGLVLQGYTSQSANNLEIQNSSGTVLSNFDSVGNLVLGNLSTKGLSIYSTTDQITNYTKVGMYWTGSIFNIATSYGGSAVSGTLSIGTCSLLYNSYSAITLGGPSSPFFTFSNYFSNTVTAASYFSVFSCTMNGSSVAQGHVKLTPTYNQSGTSSATDLLINRTETAVGSGSQLFLDCQVASTSKFAIDHTGFIKYNNSANCTTGAGSASLGANCPANTLTSPYKWLKVTTDDGSIVYIPVWK